MRDWTSKLLRVGAAFDDTTSILVAEACASQDGLNIAIQAGFHQLIIEGDNKTAI